MAGNRKNWGPRADAGFDESSHPRSSDGKFGSGSGGGKVHSKLPFVNSLINEHGSRKAIEKHLENAAKEKLNQALTYLERHGEAGNKNDQFVKKTIEKELDDRANRGL